MTRARDLAAFVSNADGDVKFDTDTLFIDSSANKVGIQTNTPQKTLVVSKAGAGGIELEPDNTSGVSFIQFYDRTASAFDTAQIISKDLQIKTGTSPSEAMRINSSGNVGIGAASIDGNSNLQIQNDSGNALVRLRSGTSNVSGIDFGDSDDIDAGRLRYNNSSNHLEFITNGSERMRILAGGGLTFNGDTAAANALDDYEEGAWTPQVTIDGSNVTTTSSGNRYTKIGRQVFLQASILFASGTNNGLVNITGVPFNPSINSYFRGIMVNDLFDESGNYYGIVSTSGTILPRVGPINQSDGSRTLAGTDIANSINAGLYVGFVYTVG